MIKFGTDGWRALMSDSFNPPNVCRVAKAVALYLNSKKNENCVVIGYDTRRNSEYFAKLCSEVLKDSGISVVELIRPLPTPITAFSVIQKGCDGAIMLTASHNPADYNGIKFISDKGSPSQTNVTEGIERMLNDIPEDINVPEYSGAGELYDPVPEYREHLRQVIDFDSIGKSGIKVLVDPLNGAGYGILDMIVENDAGLEVDAINNYPDETFGGKSPEPSGENLNVLAEELKRQKMDIGLALDGDGDRFAAIDSAGFSPTQNLAIAMIADHLAERGWRGKIVRTIATTHLLDKIAERHNLELVETNVGFKYIAGEMISGDVLIGGEESGGLSLGRHIPEKDGLLANLLLLEAMAFKKVKSLKALAGLFFDKYGVAISKRVDLHISPEQKNKALAKISEFEPGSLNGYKVDKINRQDGHKYYLGNGSWIMVRPSGTEPVIRIYAETSQKEDIDKLITIMRNELLT